MANQLKMALIDTIQRLHQQNWSQRRIAQELQIDRETVPGICGWPRRQNQPARRGAHDSKPATSDGAPRSSARQQRETERLHIVYNGFVGPIDGKRSEPVRAIPRTYPGQARPRTERSADLAGSGQRARLHHEYHSVRRFVARLGVKTPVPFRRMECGPGEEVQVDFGQGAFIVDGDGKRRRPHVFRIVLSHSRKGYSEVVLRQTTDAFLMCLENAFWHFGGVPKADRARQSQGGGAACGLVRSRVASEDAGVRGALRMRIFTDQATDAETQGKS